jgi:ubiquitin-conjugating enzyme (huntingtin interacting protein 2)
LQDIVIPSDYPFRPAKVTFTTKVYYPNIFFVTGVIFVDILSDQWHPIISLQKLLLSLQSFLCGPELCGPEPDEPQDVEVAKQFASSRQNFEDIARTWTHIYARRSYPSGEHV